MNDLFHEYISRNLGKIDLSSMKKDQGPVVTISRAAGCHSLTIANLLAKHLNERNPKVEWSVISKELLHDSAEELQLHPDVIRDAFWAEDRSFLDEVVHAFTLSEYYMERKIRNTIIKVIRRFAIDGHKIILGRAGNIVCSDFEHCLNIRIDAGIKWRIDQMMKNKGISREEAISQIAMIERNRQNFVRSVKGKLARPDDYDLVLNQEMFGDEQMVSMIEMAMKLKHL